jgi:hypothetical protein
MRYWLITVILSVCVPATSAQVFETPVIGIKSHQTMEVLKAEVSGNKIVFHISIENMISGGSFCADRNIFMVEPGGKRYRLIKANNIPVCPDVYQFKSPGEKLFFNLEFPYGGSLPSWIDIVEECSNNCFWLFGIIMDENLNRRINDAFITAASGSPSASINLFSNILVDIENLNTGVEGLIYLNIVHAANAAGDKTAVQEWYRKMTMSGAPHLEQYLKFLNEMGIK